MPTTLTQTIKVDAAEAIGHLERVQHALMALSHIDPDVVPELVDTLKRHGTGEMWAVGEMLERLFAPDDQDPTPTPA